MKIGIVLTGISHGHGRDFRHCSSDIFQNIIYPLKSAHEVSLYITTYKSEFDNLLLKTYLPKKYQFLDFSNSHQVTTYIKSMELLRGEDLDFIICTRFDIHFHKKISEVDLNFQKFNVLFKEIGHWKWWGKHKFTSDNFFAFPISQLDVFILILNDIYKKPSRIDCTDLHNAFYRMQKFLGKEATNIVSKKPELSDFNSFFSLCRNK